MGRFGRRPERKQIRRPGIQPRQGPKDPRCYCPYCDSQEHTLTHCKDFNQLTTDQKRRWIKMGRRCWRCGRNHFARDCDLKRRCQRCNKVHLNVLHDLHQFDQQESKTRHSQAGSTNGDRILTGANCTQPRGPEKEEAIISSDVNAPSEDFTSPKDM